MKMTVEEIIKKSSVENMAQIIGAVVAMQTMGITEEEAIGLEYPQTLKVLQSYMEVDYKPTNADRIRSMSDEELAEFLADSEKFSPCKNCDFHFVDAMNDDCKAPDGWICTKGYAAALIQKFLQSEVY